MDDQLAVQSSPPVPVYSIALLSASAIAYEILLVRLFSIIQWHHYAYMVISLALMGYGASGTFLAFTGKKLLSRFQLALTANIILFAVAAFACFLVAQSIPFNPDEMGFDADQWIYLVAMYLVLAIPFFFAANAIGLSLAYTRSQLAQVYAADLMGAGVGSLAVVLLLFFVFPLPALQLLVILGLLSAFVASWETRFRRSLVGFMVLLLSASVVVSGKWIDITPSPYKDLQQALRITGSHVIAERSSPMGLISVVDSPVVPFRHAPGLSLNATAIIPQQRGVYIDGNGPLVINRDGGKQAGPDFMNHMTSALPYHVADHRHILVPASGTGTDIRQALLLSHAEITAVEINPQIIAMMQGDYRDYSGGLYSNPRVRVINAEIRGFLQGSEETYDLINIPLMDSFNVSSTGLLSLSEDYMFTAETIALYLQRLNPDGMLAINRWIRMPPRDMFKILGTVVEVLEKQGVHDIHERLAIIRGWQTSILLVKNGVITEKERENIRHFAEQQSFDLVYLPGMHEAEANRFNMLAQPYYYQAAVKLLGPSRQQFIDNYKFNLQPATDDKPYFFNFFKWSSLPEILELHGRGGVPLIDTGYLVIVATLMQAVLVGGLLVLLPLYFLRRRSSRTDKKISAGRVFVYFSALGVAFLLIEIAFIQKLTLFLHHPLYAIAVSLASFLLFAGLGSQWSRRFVSNQSRSPALLPAGMVIVLCMVYLAGLDFVFAQLLHYPDVIRIVFSIVMVAPLAFFMGMPFPLGMTSLSEYAEDWLPWAWGINGCASVVSAILATLIAIHYGFSTVILAGAVLYAISALTFPVMKAEG